MYETWGLAGGRDSIDLGVVFLENAYRCLKLDGRLGIVLSNSLASINKWQKVREWLMLHMRIVALFDLPPNVFAETGVNTTLIVAYKPKPKALKRLTSDGYSVFVRDIQRVGYEKRTAKRNVIFNPVYKLNDRTFEIETDADGRPVLDEEFTETASAFRQWTLEQEETLQRVFIREA
jgi:type I restriction enzyme M protein